ncbi:MAG: adenylosuccinate synthase [Candidatus Peribacteraceae bacterium]|nr:adenylosuccinate synthase [Candidatus Peribacteraceae bacterium]
MQQLLESLGPVTAVIGAQWGDEGKGKAIDLLAEHFDVIARACGGANAGHTIVVQGKKHVFHLLPAGSLHENKTVFLGSGMVIHLPTLLEEIETLRQAGVDIVPRLRLSEGAHIVFDYHKDIDGVTEERRAKATGGKIGTTKRGIGPAYTDKAARTGMRLGDLKSFGASSAALRKELGWRAKLANAQFGVFIDTKKEEQHLLQAWELLRDRIVPMRTILDDLDKKKRILIEGAQATLLDLDHGTYPFVTSSFTTAAGAMQGLGLPPRALTSCIGVAKAYCTRVGEGIFPTEVEGETGDRLRERGGEYGATTGRPRRCGWLALDDLDYAARLNGCTHWNITKLDVLDEEAEIPVGVATENGKATFEKLSGWKSPTRGMRDFATLPAKAQEFIRFIEGRTKVPVALIGTGPGREEMIIR